MNNNDFGNNQNNNYEVYSKSYTPTENGYEEYKNSYSSVDEALYGKKRSGIFKKIAAVVAVALVACSICGGIVAITASVVSNQYAELLQSSENRTDLSDNADNATPGRTQSGHAAVLDQGGKNTGYTGEVNGNWFYGLDENTDITVENNVNKPQTNGKIGDDNLSMADVVDLVSNSVVEITTSETLRNGLVYSSGAGSGVIVTDTGIIITNNHVVESATEISVRLANGNVYDAALVATDEQTDLAVIKITPEEELTVAVGVNSDSVRVGDEVLAIGNPLGVLGGTVTNGIVSALERAVTIEGETMTLLQHNAAVSPGNSGGALFNMKGQLIGIVNAKYSSNGAEGLGFAIPMNTVTAVYDDLITFGYVKGRADHGLSIIEQYTLRPGYYGYILYIVESRYNSELLYGDRLVAIDGKAPSSADNAYAMLEGKEIGDTVEITVIRSGEEITVELVISEYHP